MPEPARQSRLRELVASYPPTTLFFTAVCAAVYVLGLLIDIDVSLFAINPFKTVFQYELYRIYTSAFFHGGIMHIAMNMMSLQALGTSLERLFGSTMFFLLITAMIFWAGVLYVVSCVVLAAVTRDASWVFYQSVGFSGVLFSLASLECFLSPVANRSIFGLITVPTKLYPWALLVVLQVMLPNISLVGHLSGYSGGKLDWAVPSFKGVQELEAMPFMDRVVALGGFVRCPDSSPVHAGSTDSRSTLRMAFDSAVAFFMPVWRCFRPLLMPVYHVVLAPVIACLSKVVVTPATAAARTVARVVRAAVAGVRRRASPPQQTNWGSGTVGAGVPSTMEGEDDALVLRRDGAV